MGTILVVEDEPDIADLVKYHLEKAGLPARVVADGKQALDLILREQPDLVVLDLMLPGLDGLELCRRLRGSAATRGIPVIMLTAKTEEVDRIVGLEMGADDYVPKPFSPRELVARVKAVLRRSRRGGTQVEGRRRGEALSVDAGSRRLFLGLFHRIAAVDLRKEKTSRISRELRHRHPVGGQFFDFPIHRMPLPASGNFS